MLINKAHPPQIIIIDSSIIIDSLECKVDLRSEIERLLSRKLSLSVLSGTISEIEDILGRSKSKKRRKFLALALEIAKRFNKLDYNPLGEEEMDDVIVRVATNLRAIVATNDGGLRKRLIKAGTPVLFLRGKSHMEADGCLDSLESHWPESSEHYQYEKLR